LQKWSGGELKKNIKNALFPDAVVVADFSDAELMLNQIQGLRATNATRSSLKVFLFKYSIA